MNNTFTRASFFSNSNSTFIFIAHFFRGAAGAYAVSLDVGASLYMACA